MSTLEERLARDIAAVTGGVVVTESDLKDAHDSVEERLEFGRQRSRRRTVAAVVAAAVVVPIVGVAVARSLDSDRSVPVGPVAPSESPGAVQTGTASDGVWLTGRSPTPELVQGVWREDNGAVHLRFSAPNAFASDNHGRLFHDPGLVGTWQLVGDQITINVTGGAAGCAGERIAMRASLAKEGVLHVVPTRPTPSRCSFLFNGWGALEQVLPTSPAWAGFRNPDQPGWRSWPAHKTLAGLWVAEGGGYAMEIGADGTYYVADQSGEPVDRGEWSYRDAMLTLTSSAQSVGCSKGGRLVWSHVEQLPLPGTLALRGTAQENTCGAPWAPKHWILVPDERTR